MSNATGSPLPKGEGNAPPTSSNAAIHDTQICSASGQNSIDFVACSKIATNHGRNSCLVAYPVAQRGQKTTAIDWLAVNCCLACSHLDNIAAMGFEHLSNAHRVFDS